MYRQIDREKESKRKSTSRSCSSGELYFSLVTGEIYRVKNCKVEISKGSERERERVEDELARRSHAEEI